jgi:hypothetical protein
MSYREFSLKEVRQRFGMSIVEAPDLFSETLEIEPSAALRSSLDDALRLAADINTEKARSEFVIAPILMEVRARLDRRIALFSGVEFDVDPERGLNGTCDFVLSRSPVQLYLVAPHVVVVEAKNEDTKGGLGQCAASMVAARLFNDREGGPSMTIYGAVTTGSTWRFLLHDGPSIIVDQREYHAHDRLPKILGIFLHMFADEPTGVLAVV